MSRRKCPDFWTLDAETDPFKAGRVPKPFIWGLYNGADNDYHEFAKVADAIEFIKDRRTLVYAHNGGRFDFHYLREHIESAEPIMVISGRLASFKVGQAEFRDSMNVLVNPLRAFSKEEIDYRKLEAAVRDQHMEEIRRYLRSDCVNLWETLKRYFDEYGVGLTQAGAAMRYWKQKYKIPFTQQTDVQAIRYRDYYYGGRVQCFVAGHAKLPFSVVDINSAYPRAMQEQHPIAPDTAAQLHMPSAKLLPRSFVKIRAVSKGAFPFRGDDGRLSFPDDGQARDYSVTGWELQAAMELNLVRVEKVQEARVFKQTINFADYVDHFWNARKEAKATGDKAGDTFAKLFLNSLYGKWAADPLKYHEYVLCEPDEFVTYHRRGFRPAVNWGARLLMERPLPEDKHRYYNVATAASITGWVRAFLLRGLTSCSGVLYCDTDSIAARDVSGLKIGTGLGEWKLEMQGCEYAIAAKKTYAFRDAANPDKWKVASKGVQLSADEIIRCAKGETVEHAPTVPTYSVFEPVPQFTKRVIRRTNDALVIT